MLIVRNARFVVPSTPHSPWREALKSIYGLSLWAVALLCIALLGQAAAAADGGFNLGMLVGGLL
jgi:hypothetical protein